MYYCACCKMFMSYEVIATFGISAILSFSISAVILVIIAAKKGLFRVGANRKKNLGSSTLTHAIIEKKGQIGSPLLVTPTAPPLPMIVELAPLKDFPRP